MKRTALSLKGKRVIITRSASGIDAWKKYFERLGAKVYSFPTIEIIPIEPNGELIDTLKRISDFDWIVVTSIESLRAMRSIAEHSGITISPHGFPRVAILGAEGEKGAQKMGYSNLFRPSIANTTALGWELPLSKHSQVLFMRSAIASRTLPKILVARDAIVTERSMYRTLPIKNRDDHFLTLLEKNDIDYLTFASPSAVRGFFVRVDKKFHAVARRIPVVAIGPVMLKTLKKMGFKNIRVAAEPTAEGMANAMI